jgi:transposase-like protein
MTPSKLMRTVADMLKAIHAAEDREAAQEKAEAVIEKLSSMRLKEATQRVQDGIAETLTYYSFPASHWRRIRTNNPLDRKRYLKMDLLRDLKLSETYVA